MKNSLEKLSEALIELDEARCAAATERLMKEGEAPAEILARCEKALSVIGEKFAAGEYYIAGLIMAGELMSRVADKVMPRLSQGGGPAGGKKGRVLIGTVEGDIHALGKDIAGALISAHGFKVKDLGVDVPPGDFVRECESFQPDLVGLSVLLTSCLPNLAETVAGLRGLRGEKARPYIFISGAPIRDEHVRRFKADFSVVTAFDAVHLCEKLSPSF